MNDNWYYHLVYREWKANKVAHLLIIGILALSMVLYGFYGIWSESAGLGDYSTEPMDTPAPLIAFYPDWTSSLADRPYGEARGSYSMEQTVQHPRIQDVTRYITTGLITHVYSEVGSVDAWGVDADDSFFANRLEVVQGDWLSPHSNEVLITTQLADELGGEIGDALNLGFLPHDGGSRRCGEFVIGGMIEARSGFERKIVLVREMLADLTNMTNHNAAWLWHEPGPRRGVERVYGALQDVLPRVRAPAYPYHYSEGQSGATDLSGHPSLGRLGGVPSPFMHRVTPIYWYETAVSERLANISQGGVISVSGLVALMFLLVAVALTITVLVMVLDRQSTIGLYSTLGMKPGDIGDMFRMQLIFDSMAGTLLGVGMLQILLTALGTQQTLSDIPQLTIILGLFLQVALILWGARVAAELSGSRDLRAHLRGDTDFDWWSLIRIWPTPAGVDSEGDESYEQQQQ